MQQFVRHKRADIAEDHINIAIAPEIVFLVLDKIRKDGSVSRFEIAQFIACFDRDFEA